MTTDDYQLWTGETVNYSTEDWARIVQLAAGRVASFLCLDALPVGTDGKYPDDLQELLANFISAVIKRQGDHAEVTTKRVRNFTITFGGTNAANAFAKVAQNYPDLIDKYSECATGVCVEKSSKECCYGCI